MYSAPVFTSCRPPCTNENDRSSRMLGPPSVRSCGERVCACPMVKPRSRMRGVPCEKPAAACGWFGQFTTGFVCHQYRPQLYATSLTADAFRTCVSRAVMSLAVFGTELGDEGWMVLPPAQRASYGSHERSRFWR